MAEYQKPESQEAYLENFEQIKPAMNTTEAFYESSRCLFCYDAPCVNACPTEIDIPLFIRQINSSNNIGAAQTIFDSNWFGHACGKVCPTEVLCEGACVFNAQNVKPIEIGRLQSFATKEAIEKGERLFVLEENNGKKVAIIGAGPAGIACASELRTLGYDVDIFEAKSQPSGLTVHGVAPYKITNEEVLEEMTYLQTQLGFIIVYNKAIQTREALEDLEERYDAIFLGIGLGATRSLNIPGENLENSFGAVEFIEKLKAEQHKISIGKNVIVIGGGNTAMDAASESARMGSGNVVLAYRRSKDEMSAYDFEYDLAKAAGVEGMFNVQPVEILGRQKVESVRFIKTQIEKGSINTIPGSEFELECDMFIRASGQLKQAELLNLIPGLELDEKERIKLKEGSSQTHNPRYFAGGDAVNGGAEVVNAAAEGKSAAHNIHEWLAF